MKTTYILIIFAVLCAVQLFVPVQMISNREEVLASGTAYKFKTVPIDPADPFRGKYITLNFEIDGYKTNDTTWQRDETIYVYLNVDSLGYAQINEITRQVKPDLQKDFIEAKVGWYDNYSKELNIEFPFNRFYMEETKAYEAELAVRENQSDSLLQNVYALVHIKEGATILKDVIINDLPIKDYVEIYSE